MKSIVGLLCFYLCLLSIAGCQRQYASFYFQPVFQEENKKSIYVKSCNTWESYVPDTFYISHTPERYVRMNIHFVRTANGENNFSEEAGKHFAQQLIGTANERLKHNQKMRLPLENQTPVLPIRVQYIIEGNPNDPSDNGIYFHNDDEHWFANKKGGANYYYSAALFEKHGIRKTEVLNLFFVEHHPDSIASETYRATGDGICMGQWGKMVNCFREYKGVIENTPFGSIPQFDLWGKAGLFNHEIGHCLGLAHSWNTNDGCDDTPLHPNCWDHLSEKGGCDTLWSNNMMDYNNLQNALTPCQIGKIHANSYNNIALRMLLKNTWCQPQSKNNWNIRRRDNVAWKGNKDVEGDLIIQEKATLKICCKVSIPENGKIVVKPGAKLILEAGALLTNDCGLSWQGIEIQKNEKDEGVVEMIQGARLEHNIN